MDDSGVVLIPVPISILAKPMILTPIPIPKWLKIIEIPESITSPESESPIFGERLKKLFIGALNKEKEEKK